MKRSRDIGEMRNLDYYATECILEMSTMLSCWDPEGEIAEPMRWSLFGDPVPKGGRGTFILGNGQRKQNPEV